MLIITTSSTEECSFYSTSIKNLVVAHLRFATFLPRETVRIVMILRIENDKVRFPVYDIV